MPEYRAEPSSSRESLETLEKEEDPFKKISSKKSRSSDIGSALGTSEEIVADNEANRQ